MLTKREAFITLKDQETDATNKPSCRLINPAATKICLKRNKTEKYQQEKIITEPRQCDKRKAVIKVISYALKRGCSVNSIRGTSTRG